ncbi:uncharacterized protein with LGFP repeats [Streptomyces sp. B3I7]|uniref:peptidoglycan recognition protein family protein n=1 Tax=Streptomyces sp. B3I7 TaxID=3042269 RepID=UPI00277D69DE|nr:peptidoglycan recognition protein [Streptomyces sp. B3I7]MDQ0813055.1 uncharacterized protein with LGFP repeats [Streptomyces sp. B3I7]
MRGYLASSIGVTCAAALTLPLAPTAATAAVSPSQTVSTAARGAATGPLSRAVPGSTQSLALAPLPRTRAGRGAGAGAGSGVGAQGLTRREVRPFSLVGVVWDDPGAALHGTVQVRTRATATHEWSGWQEVDTHNDDHAADPGTAESRSGRVRGSTAPLWVGDSDGVEVRVRPAAEPGAAAPAREPAEPGTDSRTAAEGSAGATDPRPVAWELPGGLRLELVDPGERPDAAPAPVPALGPASAGRAFAPDARTAEAAAANADLAPADATVIPALSKEETEEAFAATLPDSADGTRAKPYIGPRPSITTRRGWGADEGIRKGGFLYTKKVKAAFVHHTATGNKYTCAQAPSVIRGIYRYHVLSSGWRDIGYNFLVDKCGKIYEGRAGGVGKAVMGAHTLGFNTDSTGIAVLGTYGSKKPSAAAVKAVARLTAWKLGLYGVNPKGTTHLTSGGGNLYAKGRKVRLHTISGHRDGFATSCPGKRLYAKLGSARSAAAGYQGR